MLIKIWVMNAAKLRRPGITAFLLLTALFFILISTSCKISPKPPDRYALVYGVSEYDSSIYYNGYYFSSLEYTDNDAVDIAAALREKDYSVRLRINNSTEPADAMATRQQFESDLNYYSQNLSKKDILLIYFSGHGAQSYPANWNISNDEDKFSDVYDEYLVFYQENANYKNHTISDTYLYSLIKKLPNRKVVLIIDVCHSGGFIGQYSDFDAISPDYENDDKQRNDIFSSSIDAFFNPSQADITPDAAIVLTASGEREFSAEPRKNKDTLNVKNGFFTESILHAFTHADMNKDGYIDTLELYNGARDYFVYLSNSYYLDYMPHISGGPVDFILFEAD